MAKSSKSTGSKSNFSYSGFIFCTLVIIVATIVIQNRNASPLNEYLSKKISSTKPYETFEEFYPHYIREHSQTTTRIWHYVGTTLFLLYILFNPFLILPISAAGVAAYSIMPFLRHLSSGLGEAGVFVLVYLIGGKLLTGSFKKLLIPMALGYSFAWVGHFVYEQNKPATFIYPTFSLMGDFRMIYDAIKRQSF